MAAALNVLRGEVHAVDAAPVLPASGGGYYRAGQQAP